MRRVAQIPQPESCCTRLVIADARILPSTVLALASVFELGNLRAPWGALGVFRLIGRRDLAIWRRELMSLISLFSSSLCDASSTFPVILFFLNLSVHVSLSRLYAPNNRVCRAN